MSIENISQWNGDAAVRGSVSREPTATWVAMLFVDVEASTELMERVGDVEAYRRIQHVHGTASESASRWHGEEVEIRGDGVLLAFPSAAEGLECAIGIQQELSHAAESQGERIRVRMGLHAGDAIRVGTGYFGRTVVLAARLADRAHGDEVLVSEVVREDVRSQGIDFGSGHMVRLKGLRDQHRIYRVAWWRSDLDQPPESIETDSDAQRAGVRALHAAR